MFCLIILFHCWAIVEDCGSILKQHWVSAMYLLMCIYSRPSVGVVLGQRRRRLTSIVPAMGCIGWVGLHRVYEVHRIDAYTDFPGNVTVLSGVKKTWQVLHGCCPALAMVVEGICLHVEDKLVSLVLSLIISWTFRSLAHEEDQYSFVYRIY